MARDPANTGWQRDLSVSHDKIGDVLVAQGDGAGALAAFRRGLEIAEDLAARDPANTEWQRDLSVSHNKIGEVLVVQGDGAGALAAFRRGLEIAEELVACDPANTGWQRDLSVSHDRIGDVLVAQGDGAGALAAFRRSLEIAEELVARDPANTGWQRDLSVSHDRIGDVLVAQGDGAGALTAFRRSLEIREELVARDPANALWQIDVAVSCSKLGAAAELSAEARRSYLAGPGNAGSASGGGPIAGAAGLDCVVRRAPGATGSGGLSRGARLRLSGTRGVGKGEAGGIAQASGLRHKQDSFVRSHAGLAGGDASANRKAISSPEMPRNRSLRAALLTISFLVPRGPGAGRAGIGHARNKGIPPRGAGSGPGRTLGTHLGARQHAVGHRATGRRITRVCLHRSSWGWSRVISFSSFRLLPSYTG